VCFDALPVEVADRAKKNFELLKANPSHPSLHFKALANTKFFSVRIGLAYRALGVETGEGVRWFWIGSHADYDRLIG
jgi:hypothetical protein